MIDSTIALKECLYNIGMEKGADFLRQGVKDSSAHNTSLTFTKRIRIPKRKTGPKQK